MVASQNGWRANDPSVISSQLIPGTSIKLRVRNDAPGQLLVQVAQAFDRTVEDIDGPLDDWGYAERNVRGSSDVSNHASGTAIDLNATRHPLGKVGTFSTAQVASIHRIIGVTRNVVRWGGDYSGRKDEMHFEINDGQDLASCQRALNDLKVFNSGAPTAPAPTPIGATLQTGSTGPAVQKLQGFLNRYYKLNLATDGIFGPATKAAVERFQRSYGHGLTVDGIVGPATRKAMGLK